MINRGNYKKSLSKLQVENIFTLNKPVINQNLSQGLDKNLENIHPVRR